MKEGKTEGQRRVLERVKRKICYREGKLKEILQLQLG